MAESSLKKMQNFPLPKTQNQNSDLLKENFKRKEFHQTLSTGPLTVRQHIKNEKLVLDWVNFLFLISIKIIALIGIPLYYLSSQQTFTYGPWLLCFVLYWAAGLSVTIGYHRLFSHKTFKAHPFIETLLLFFGSMAIQNSALKWSSDHRLHHAYTDTPKDPYNSKLGFWWSHIIWIFFDRRKDEHLSTPYTSNVETLKRLYPNAKDLIQNPRVRFQHSLGILPSAILSLLIPALIGLYLGNVWGYFLIAGVFRIILVHQSTFFINSLAHILGKQTYSKNETARDNFLCSLLAFGEGYHNFHHTYPNDYRNGIRFFQFDPSKWIISFLSYLNLTSDLKKTKGF